MARLPPANRTRAAIDIVADYIAQAGLKPSERLPTEHELMGALGIGRSTVREVMRHFQALGVVETRRGSGSFLRRSISAATVHMPLSFDPGPMRDGLLRTLDVRRGLEVEASMLAAVRAEAADIETMRATLEEMERVHLEKGTAGREDLAFHLSIYDATRNPLFGQLLAQMREAFELFFEKPFDRPDFARRSFPFHRELFDAIRAGDPAGAREKTLQILAIVEEDIKDMSQ
ncbi:FadR/GntR family transcriptional regulator [Aureimonas sp. AU22]|uniref:FadR/GntR family transcriptional regulator n=1 Tax=Aureimonas sp. AU22 TaxID=1638162 RepID=UPI000782D558|nr:FadR/GntR family transcriptional regulator [Aureimonas sp. AU22]